MSNTSHRTRLADIFWISVVVAIVWALVLLGADGDLAGMGDYK